MTKFYKPVSIDYDLDFIYDLDWKSYETSIFEGTINHLRKIHDNFPDTYSSHNTSFYQILNVDEHFDMKIFNSQLGIEGKKITLIKQPPGMILPIHNDTFYQLSNLYPEDSRTKVRANIFLEDWKWGHIFQLEDKVISHWKKNTGYMWNSNVLHLAANCGLTPRYSLQISGFLLKS